MYWKIQILAAVATQRGWDRHLSMVRLRKAMVGRLITCRCDPINQAGTRYFPTCGRGRRLLESLQAFL